MRAARHAGASQPAIHNLSCRLLSISTSAAVGAWQIAQAVELLGAADE